MDISERILRDYSVIAVVGASRDPRKAAQAIPAQLQAAGFRIVPVNPYADTILGERVYARLEDIPFPIELVLVFRPAPDTPQIARSAVAIGAKALWLQQGILSAEARLIANKGRLAYVQDECAGVVRGAHRIRKQPAPD